MKKFIFIFIFFLSISFNSYAASPYFLDFKYVLNNSAAGKKAQTFLKSKLDKGIKSIQEKEKNLLSEEKKLIEQKKILSSEDYKNKVNELRSKVSSLQKERNSLLNSVAKQRAKAKNELLKTLNPIIKEYMKENNIRMVLHKKSLLLADENLEITDQIIKRLDKKLKSIKLN